mgnify:CR=1 FL=1
MDAVLYIIAGSLFLISFVAHLYIKVHLRPQETSDLDDYYHEFEHHHPGFAKYTKWSKITFAATILCALLLFLAAVI